MRIRTAVLVITGSKPEIIFGTIQPTMPITLACGRIASKAEEKKELDYIADVSQGLIRDARARASRAMMKVVA